jgi:2-polyprenyl-3-methyl-5-hydroxy-6-metoxy-1,4-benzoquinol methylase
MRRMGDAPEPSPRTAREFYAQVETAHLELNPRLELFLSEYRRHRAAAARPLRVLDVGCGRRALLSRYVDPSDDYMGCDIVPEELAEIEAFKTVDLNSESLLDHFDGPFDIIFCGEVIEHLFNPDALLDDLKALMADDALLVLSTPNLAYLVNRVLLLVGISPLFLENSARQKLGRRTKLLGQGNETQGHIRVFTYRAVLDLLELQQLDLLRVYGVPVWANLVDRFVAKLSPRFAGDIVYVVKKRSAQPVS